MPQEEILTRKRLRSAYITTIMSLTLVLFMLGLWGLIGLHANKISRYVKENLGFTIYFQKNTRETEILRLKKSMDTTRWVKSAQYISPEEAEQMLKKELGEDFIGFLGYNPLLPCLQVRLNAEYTNPDSIQQIEKRLKQNPKVAQIEYQRDLINKVNQNLNIISIIIAVLSLLMFLISIGLINNTIKLSVYSKRFIIRSMMLVGATRSFIRAPFVRKGLWHGILSALFAILLLAVLLYFTYLKIPELQSLADMQIMLSIPVGMILCGALISAISNYIAVTRFLNMNIDKLYL